MWFFIFVILCLVGVAVIINQLLFFESYIAFAIGVVFIIPMILGVTLFSPDTEVAVYEEYEIYALKDNITINGSGSLFYHYIDSDLNYHVRTDYKDGKKVIELDGDKVYLFEFDGDSKVEVYKTKRLNHLWLWDVWGGTVDIKITVPENTMTDEFKSDME